MVDALTPTHRKFYVLHMALGTSACKYVPVCAHSTGCVHTGLTDHNTHTRTHVAVGLMDSEEAKAEQANHVLLRHVKPWAVRFDDGERHTYTKEQMQEKFGITDIQPGQAVEHKVRGRGAVMPNETAEALKERKEMLMESLRDMESAPLPAAAAAALKYS